jgi:hypothetical protein
MQKIKSPFSTSIKLVIILFVLLVSLRGWYYWNSDGFSLFRIEHSQYPKGKTLPPPTEEQIAQMQKICSQPFVYLGKGSQAYAFISQDGQWVLKLFKYYHLKPIPWMEIFTRPPYIGDFIKSHLERRKKKAELTLSSYQIAHDLIPAECGLVYLQIEPSHAFHQTVNVTDKIGRSYTIDLEKHGFMLQKRAYLVFPTLNQWVKNGQVDRAKQFIHSLIQLLVERCKKGVQDQDPDLHKNAGIIGTGATFIDVGSFHVSEDAKQAHVIVRDIRRITRGLREWCQAKSPELDQFLESEIVSLEKPAADLVSKN